MSWYKVFPVLLAAGILSLLIPLTLALAQGGSGTVTIMDSNESGSGDNMSDKATINIMDVPSLPDGQAYEGWFVSDSGERKESTGILSVDPDGMISHTFMLMSNDEPTGENLFADFNTFVVTIEPVPDDDPGPSDEIALVHAFPAGAIAQIRNLVFSTEGNPEYTSGFHEGTPKGTAVGLREQARVALTHANLATEASNLAGVQQHIEHVVNIIEGMEGSNAGDLNGDGETQNPGDGFGVLNYAAGAGSQAGMVAADGGMMAMYAGEVMESASQTAMWAGDARDLALQAMGVEDFDAARIIIGNAAVILERALNGLDANGNGTIERTTGEGGAMQAYSAAQAMGTYMVETPPTLPKPGDAFGSISYSIIALMGLAIGAFLLAGGLFTLRLTRSRVSH